MEDSGQGPGPNGTGNKPSTFSKGLSKLLFTTVVLLLLFGALNYFNILSLSGAFPNQFGWLPHKPMFSQNNSARGNFSPVYNYITVQPLLTSFIKDNVKNDFLPKDIVLKKDIAEDGKTSTVFFDYPTPQATVAAYIHYLENTSLSDEMKIFVRITEDKNQPLSATAATANLLVNKYFLNARETLKDSDCKSTAKIYSCEIFKEQKNGKFGYGFAIFKSLPLTPKVVFSCLIPKDNKDYMTMVSCINF